MVEDYSTAFYAGVAVFAGAATGVFIYNAFEWNTVRSNIQASARSTDQNGNFQTFAASNPPLTPVLPSIGTIDFLFWISVIWAVFGAIIFIWAIIMLFRGLYATETTVTTETKTPQYVVVQPRAATGAARQVESTKTTTFVPTTTTANLVTPGSAEDLRFIANQS
jgi:hypothetical protein